MNQNFSWFNYTGCTYFITDNKMFACSNKIFVWFNQVVFFKTKLAYLIFNQKIYFNFNQNLFNLIKFAWIYLTKQFCVGSRKFFFRVCVIKFTNFPRWKIADKIYLTFNHHIHLEQLILCFIIYTLKFFVNRPIQQDFKKGSTNWFSYNWLHISRFFILYIYSDKSFSSI